jgi:hypothetical protein
MSGEALADHPGRARVRFWRAVAIIAGLLAITFIALFWWWMTAGMADISA